MYDFLKFIDDLRHGFAIHVSITYNKTTDWEIYVYKKGCAEDYPKSPNNGEDAILCLVQESDIELAFARAQIAVKEWLLEHDGGY